MPDQPVTKKEFVNLEKLVIRMVKEFDEEKQFVHDELGKKSDAAMVDDNVKKLVQNVKAELKKWLDDEKDKWTNAVLETVYETMNKHIESTNQNRIWTEKTFAERKTWFDDEKKWVHGSIEDLINAVNNHARLIKELQS
jgi:hypothetical protein